MSGCRLLFVLQTFRPTQIKNKGQLTQVLQASYGHSSFTRNKTPPFVPFLVQGFGRTITTT